MTSKTRIIAATSASIYNEESKITRTDNGGQIYAAIVIFTCIACWVLTSVLLPGLEVKESSYPLWNIVNIPAWANRIVSFLLFAGIGYFLIELNNTFAIIRMRASVQTSLYFLLITAAPACTCSMRATSLL